MVSGSVLLILDCPEGIGGSSEEKGLLCSRSLTFTAQHCPALHSQALPSSVLALRSQALPSSAPSCLFFGFGLRSSWDVRRRVVGLRLFRFLSSSSPSKTSSGSYRQELHASSITRMTWPEKQTGSNERPLPCLAETFPKCPGVCKPKPTSIPSREP